MRLTCWRLGPRDRGLYYESANASSFWRDAKTGTRGRVRYPIWLVFSFREKSHCFNRGHDAIEQQFGIKSDRERYEREETSSAFFHERDWGKIGRVDRALRARCYKCRQSRVGFSIARRNSRFT